jgi:hypothetical protein
MHNFKSVIRTLEQKDESEFWNYITGLRGPDNSDDVLKALTTCVIRGHTNGAGGSWGIRHFLGYLSREFPENKIDYHFQYHHRRALEALIYYFKVKKDIKRAVIVRQARDAWYYGDYKQYMYYISKFVRMG